MLKLFSTFKHCLYLAITNVILVYGALLAKFYLLPYGFEISERMRLLGEKYPEYSAMTAMAVRNYSGLLKIANAMASVVLSLSVVLLYLTIVLFFQGKAKYCAKDI